MVMKRRRPPPRRSPLPWRFLSVIATALTMMLHRASAAGAGAVAVAFQPSRPTAAAAARLQRRRMVTMMAAAASSSSAGTADGGGGNLLERLGSPTAVAAPMVQQSDLAFRTMARRHGCGLCYTQMFHAAHFADVAVYRKENWDGPDSYPSASSLVADELAAGSGFDRPLIAQFAGDEPEVLVRAARHVEHLVDAVDLNLGCPQRIAKRGHYGAFLLEEPELVASLLGALVRGLSVPVTAKIRVLPTEAATLELAKRIEATGVSLLTVHGRTKEQNKIHVGGADWAIIRRVKEELRIPVVANGGIETYDDYRRCLEETGADAVMSSEGLLENPGLFSPGPASTLLLDGRWNPRGPYASREEEAFALAERQLGFAEEYLALAARFWPREGVAAVKGHLFKFLYQLLELPQHHDLREKLGEKGNKLGDYVRLVAELRETRYASLDAALAGTGGLVVAPTSWYRRHRVGAANHRKTDALLERPMEERLLSLKERLLRRRAAREQEEEQKQAAMEAMA